MENDYSDDTCFLCGSKDNVSDSVNCSMRRIRICRDCAYFHLKHLGQAVGAAAYLTIKDSEEEFRTEHICNKFLMDFEAGFWRGVSTEMASTLAYIRESNAEDESDDECMYVDEFVDPVAERAKMSNGLRFDVMKRDDFHCQLCGATGKTAQLVIDHIVPVSKGGKTEQDNLQTLCFRCNSGKRDKVE